MHPANLACLTQIRPAPCVLANNHSMDHGPGGLEDTLEALASVGVPVVGAGRSLREAQQPAIIALRGAQAHRAIVIGTGSPSSGVPAEWRASADRAGVDWLSDLSDDSADTLVARIQRLKRAGDLAIVSIHWGSNWGYDVPSPHVRFAHRLIDGGVDMIHGHSSHHPRPIEVYRDRPILYGCGDFINDYEGISGYEYFRDDLVLMYLARFEAQSGALVQLRLVPLQIRKMALRRAAAEDVRWMRDTLDRICRAHGSRVTASTDDALELRWREL
jgi:poly-gamma-glutamate capsule biosynthesis protein CapA/YwtB (metallophosphatase superfamily)